MALTKVYTTVKAIEQKQARALSSRAGRLNLDRRNRPLRHFSPKTNFSQSRDNYYNHKIKISIEKQEGAFLHKTLWTQLCTFLSLPLNVNCCPC